MFSLPRVAKVFNISSRKCLQQMARKASILAAAKTSPDNRYMIVDVNNNDDVSKNTQLKYPLIWLRDNCQCSKCFDAQTKSRTLDWTKFKFENAQPKSISVDKHLEVTWKDSHVSTFDLKWLRDRRFVPENQKNYLDNYYRPKHKLWSKDQFVLKTFEAKDVFEKNDVFYQWLEAMAHYGAAVIKNAPLTTDQCKRLADHVGYVRETHYGKQFTIRADPNAQNVAFTAKSLQFHTDLPYYEYLPGVNLLHCITQTQSSGAVNYLADGFYAAERLKNENPKAYECLTKTLVNWCDYGEDNGFTFESILRYPVISLDHGGNVNRISHSIPQRDSFFSVDVEQVDEWYHSLRAFIDILYEEAVYFKTDPGDILAFSNVRLLHDRTSYVDTPDNVRHLVGAFIDWDEIYSRLRVLANELRANNATD